MRREITLIGCDAAALEELELAVDEWTKHFAQSTQNGMSSWSTSSRMTDTDLLAIALLVLWPLQLRVEILKQCRLGLLFFPYKTKKNTHSKQIQIKIEKGTLRQCGHRNPLAITVSWLGAGPKALWVSSKRRAKSLLQNPCPQARRTT
jgi:hypothetical protein